MRKGHPRFYELLKIIEDLHDRKNSNYAPDADPLANLRISENFGVKPWIGTLIRISDKFSRLQELAKGKKDLVGENVKDTLLDLSIYSLLAIILYEEKNN